LDTILLDTFPDAQEVILKFSWQYEKKLAVDICWNSRPKIQFGKKY